MALGKIDAKESGTCEDNDAIATLSSQISLLTKHLGISNVATIQTPITACELCGGPHMSIDCQVGNPFTSSTSKQANFVSNFQQHNPYSNSYNPG